MLMLAFLCHFLPLRIQRIASICEHFVALSGNERKEILCQTVSEPSDVPRLCLPS